MTVKSLRFKRNLAIKMISRYDEARKQTMKENGSRTAMNKNEQDILDQLEVVETLHAQIEEKLGEDEEVIKDTLILTDTRILVNNIIGLTQEHLENRSNDPPTRNDSEAGSQCGNNGPTAPRESIQERVEQQQLQNHITKQHSEVEALMSTATSK